MNLLTALLVFFAPVERVGNLLESGRIIGLTDSPSERLIPPHLMSPGQPPVFSFRTFDAKDRGRFGSLGLMTDDAGH